MNFQNVIFQTNQTPRIIAGSQELKDGSQVLVRVIADKGNGKYVGSVAGIRVNISSVKTLNVGSTFLASIHTKNGQVLVTPKETYQLKNENFLLNHLQNEQLSSLLKQFNLPPDALSLHVFQQLKQMELKENPELLRKIRTMSLKYLGKEKSASEILAILSEKGIDATQNEILQLLEELDGNFDNKDKDENSKFILMNKINTKKGKWYIVPIEILNTVENKVLGNGNIKLMVDSFEILKLMNIDCFYNEKQYLFNVEFENKKCKTIRMNVPGNNPEKSVLRLKKKIEMFDCNINVLWGEKELIEGTACATEEVVGVKGKV